MFITFWGKKSAVFRRLPIKAMWITDWAACGLSISTSDAGFGCGKAKSGSAGAGAADFHGAQRCSPTAA